MQIEMENYDVWLKGMNVVRQRVALLLEHNRELRNDDNALVFAYWCEYDNASLKMPEQAMTQASTILRRRQEIQNDEKRFPPTDPDVRRRRGWEEGA